MTLIPNILPAWVSSIPKYPLLQSMIWNDWSIIGKLNSLPQNTYPSIILAAHQCTCYSSNPSKLAIKCIGQYLLWTKVKGLILHPKPDFWLDMYGDAEFSGLWHQELWLPHPLSLQTSNKWKLHLAPQRALSMATCECLVHEFYRNSLINTPLDNQPFSQSMIHHLETTQSF